MLTKRIIPCLDVRNGRVVKGVRFENHVDMGDPAQLARFYSEQGADELVFYDISASPEKRVVDLSWVEEVARNISIPFTVAGGICSVEQAKRVFQAGADKISLNTPALENPQLIDALTYSFGSQAIVIGVDVCDEKIYSNTGDPQKTRMSHHNIYDWLQEVQKRGAGELVINSMSMDGQKEGYDVGFLHKISPFITVPIIASGGAGKLAHFRSVFEEGLVDGALAASVFHSKALLIPDVKKYLSGWGIPMRI